MCRGRRPRCALRGPLAHSIPNEETLLAGFGEFEGYPAGQYTDDTQLSLATIEAIVKGRDVFPAEIARSIARLWKTESVVGPGGACTAAAHHFLKSGDWSACGAAVGQAGNGTAMRTAVMGLFFVNAPDRLPIAVADVSRITHHDPRSVAGGVAVAKAAQLLVAGGFGSPEFFCAEIAAAMEPVEPAFADMVRQVPHLLHEDPGEAIRTIAWSGMARPEFPEPIITPFVIPTVLAALWCVLRHPDSWGKAVAAAIRLGGDVDTLGAIVGALMGAKVGVQNIPPNLLESVLNRDALQTLALRYHALVSGK